VVRQWDQVSRDFARASLEADRAPEGAPRVRAHAEVLRMAHEHHSFAEEFVARNDLVSALLDTPDDTAALPHVAWLRTAVTGAYDLDPDDLDAVLWKLEWAVEVAEASPAVPLQRWRAAVEDLEAGHAAAGRGPRAVHAARARLAHATGDAAGRDAALAAWRAAPPDDDGGCDACELREQARLLADADPGAALEALAPVLDGRLACEAEPAASRSVAADLHARRGDVDAAAGAVQQAWHAVADDPARATDVAACLRAFVRVGNSDRAVDLLLPRLGWLEGIGPPADRMWFAGTAAWVLDHGLRRGLAPGHVDGRATEDVIAGLREQAGEEAAALDARAGSTVVADALAAALDDAGISDLPAFPPTRLPPGPPAAAAFPLAVPDDVVALAEDLAGAVRVLDARASALVGAWRDQREAVRPSLEAPEHWAAASFLDRHAAQDVEPAVRRPLLEDALADAERAGDEVGAARTRCDLAVLEVLLAGQAHRSPAAPEVVAARDAAARLLGDLEQWAPPEEAAAGWRRFAHEAWPSDVAGTCRHAAELYERAGLPVRRALCVLEGALATIPIDHAAANRLIDEGERLAGDSAVLRALATDLRARMARVDGDLERAVALLESEHGMPGLPDEVRAGPLFTCCDVLVDLGAWDRLEVRAADAVALALRLQDPVALAVGQRLLGLAWLELGRPAEAAELLEAALPVIDENVPALTGPSGWALGNACVAIGRWATARSAFARAAAAFTASGRLDEASHSHLRAAHAAWDDEDPDAAARHYEDAAAAARVSGTPPVLVEALRGRAVLRALGGDVDGGLADLDAALAQGERLASVVPFGPGGDFDAEVLEPDVLREGARLLAGAGRTEEALERLTRAEALVGGGHELVIRAEAGALLADADRLEEAEPRLRRSIVDLDAAGLTEDRVRAAGALATALERAGREAEAQQVWTESGAPQLAP
jgi:tetratricopeptide (TPR) repeat protein